MVNINRCEAGLVLSKAIYDQNNRILLNKGYKLTSDMINRLKRMGISHIYADSPVTEGVSAHDDVPVGIRVETTKSLTKTFKTLTDENFNKRVKAATHGKIIREFKLVYERLVKEMRTSPKLLNLLSHLQANSDHLFEHSLNVSIYSLAIARQLAIKEHEMYWLGLGAIFHDIGKIKLEKDLLHKSSLLTKEEVRELQKHTEIGFDLLRKERELHLLVAHCAYQHHENIDGSGFPRALVGKDIHIFAQIVAVADYFDSLMRERRGKPALLPHEAMEVLMSKCFTRFDKKVLDAFKRAVAIYPIGVTVKLNTGEKAVVVDYNNTAPQRPKLRVFTDKDGNKLEHYCELDLLVTLNVMIVECDAVLDNGTLSKVVKPA